MKIGGIEAGTTSKPGEYKAIPDGTYPVKVLEFKFNKKAKSSELVYNEATLVITEGEFAGRRVWEKFAVKNASSKHVDVSKKKFEKLAKAAAGNEIGGKIASGERDVEELLEKPLSVVLTTNPKGYLNVKSFMAV